MKNDSYRSPAEQVLLEVEHLQPSDLCERFRSEEMAILAVGWLYYFFGSLLATIGVASSVAY